MKLRNIILATVAVAVSSTAFAADNNGMISKGGTYVGLAGGWGKVESDTTFVDSFEGDSGTGSSTSGGFSGRVYFGYLSPLSGNLLVGPELGFSYYANNNYHLNDTTEHINASIKQSGYGIDLLLNVTYAITNALNVAVKPGFQYSFEKLTSDNSFWWGGNNNNSMQDSKILPEINLETNWQAFANQPFFLGASYQYVFGSDGRDQMVRALNGFVTPSSRQMIALNLEYLF